MAKTFKNIMWGLMLLLGAFLIINSNIVKAETIISSDMRNEFAAASNMLSFDVDFDKEMPVFIGKMFEI